MSVKAILQGAQLYAMSTLEQRISLYASLDIQDDALGNLGMKSIPIDDPATVAAVKQFIEQMLPSLSAQLGIPVELPPPPPDPGPVVPPDTP